MRGECGGDAAAIADLFFFVGVGFALGEDAFFGEVSRFVKSDVLLRLKVSTDSPDGVMCFGSREPEAFGPDMSTELLFFLAKVLENTIRAWLDLPE